MSVVTLSSRRALAIRVATATLIVVAVAMTALLLIFTDLELFSRLVITGVSSIALAALVFGLAFRSQPPNPPYQGESFTED